MSGGKWINGRRSHDLAELADAKPVVFHDCLDCGCRVYTRNAKRCHPCAHKATMEGNRTRTLRWHKARHEKQARQYRDMLAILGIREHEGDCL